MTKQKLSPFRLTTDSTVPKNVYIDKQEMLQEIIQYQASIKEAEAQGLPEPVMSNKLGKMILDMATGLSTRYNFRNYTYQDQFVSDSVLLGLHLAKTFDLEAATRSGEPNPYSYFSFSFFRTMMGIIKKEKKNLEGKYKYILQLEVDTSAYQEGDDTHNNQFIEFLKEQVDEARSYHEKHATVDSEQELVKDLAEEEKTAVKTGKYVPLTF
jgi:hypothetical protein